MAKLTLKNFEYQDLSVSILFDNRTEEILFDASNVCEVLGYTRKTGNVLEKLDDDEKRFLSGEEYKGVTESVTPLGGYQDKWFLTEPGLYHLILRSDKPEAKPFRRWVTHEVLPAIRRTGEYRAGTSGKPDMVAIESLFSKTKKLAKAAGIGEVAAREKARQQVLDYLGVDVYELLGIEKKNTAAILPDKREQELFDRLVAEIHRTLGTPLFTVKLVVQLADYDKDSELAKILKEIQQRSCGNDVNRILGNFLKKKGAEVAGVEHNVNRWLIN